MASKIGEIGIKSVYFVKIRDNIEDKLIILKDHKKLWNIRIK